MAKEDSVSSSDRLAAHWKFLKLNAFKLFVYIALGIFALAFITVALKYPGIVQIIINKNGGQLIIDGRPPSH